MKNKIILTVAVMLLTVLTAQAVPAKPGTKRIVRQADGTLQEMTLCGDEHFSFFKDDDGQPYILNADNWLMPISQEEVSERWTALRNERLSKGYSKTRNQTRGMGRAGIPNTTIGKHRGLVILMEFKDVKFVSSDPHETFNRFFNEEGYHEYGNAGSVKDYFLKQSYGQLEIDFDIVGPYTANGSLAHYGENENGHDARPLEMTMEAIDAAAKDVDYSNYDWDNDGEVDQIFIICAGYDEAEGASSYYIWPHEWVLSAQGIYRKYNGKVLNTYGVATELWGNENTNPDGEIAGIGTACHEFSHCLGLPDFYDTSGTNFGMGDWDVMCSGNYNNRSHTPAGYTSYERMFAGWLTPTELTEMTRINDMKPIATTPECYILYNEANRDEYYLLENRQPVDFDEGLPSHGLLVLHVDYSQGSWTSNKVNINADHQRMTIMPADGELSSWSLLGDPFPGKTGNTELTNISSVVASLYNDNVDGRKLMSKSIDNIKESADGLISFVACRPELAVPEPDGGTEIEGQPSFTIKWPVVKDAIRYEVEVTEIGASASDPSEALEREFDLSGMVSKSNGFTDVSGKLKDYGLSNWSGNKLFTTPNKMRIGTTKEVGYVRTATWNVPSSTEMTIVMGANVVKAGDVVKGSLQVAYGNSGDSPTYEKREFEVTEDGRFVFHFTIQKDLFWIEIHPESQMYLNYLAVYNGTWSAEQINNAEAAATREASPRKGFTVTTYTTDTNSITLTDLNRKNRYIYKVRALGEEDTYSSWSGEKTFVFSGGSEVTKGDANGDGNVNAADIVEIVNYIMGNPSDKFDGEAADVNGDGSVNAADIVLVVNTIMSAG